MASARSALAVVIWLFVAVLGGATLLGFLDRFSWVLELVAFFRVQYAVLLAVAAVLALLLRRGRTAIVAVTLALVNVAVVAPPIAPAAERVAGPSVPVRILVANVEIGNREYERMARLIAGADADVLVLTELTPRWARALAPTLARYGDRRLALRPHAYGIGLYSRLPIAESSVERFPRAGGPPTIVARLDVRGAPFTVVATHVHRPIEGALHARQLESLAEAAPRFGTPLAICGDFNTVPWATPFTRLTERAGLSHLYEDTWPAHTWPTWNPALRLTLDNCLVRGAVVRDHDRAPDVGSDHFPLVVDLDVPRALSS